MEELSGAQLHWVNWSPWIHEECQDESLAPRLTDMEEKETGRILLHLLWSKLYSDHELLHWWLGP